MGPALFIEKWMSLPAVNRSDKKEAYNIFYVIKFADEIEMRDTSPLNMVHVLYVIKVPAENEYLCSDSNCFPSCLITS